MPIATSTCQTDDGKRRMVKPQMKMVISDDPVAEALMAKAKALHERATRIGKLFTAGHIVTLREDQTSPAFVAIRIEDEVIVDPRNAFPTVELMARIELALHAGRSHNKVTELVPRNTEIKSFRMPAALTGYALAEALISPAWMEEWAEVMECAYHNVSKITAAVTNGKAP